MVSTPGYTLVGLSKEQAQKFVDSQAVTSELGWVGTPDEIAKAVAFLVSDDSSFEQFCERYRTMMVARHKSEYVN